MKKFIFKSHFQKAVGAMALTIALSAIPSALVSAEVLPSPPSENAASLRASALPELGDTRLEKILSKYYETRFGGTETWDRIHSIVVSGQRKEGEATFEFKAIRKKPNLIKIILRQDSEETTLAFDGKNAWKKGPASAGPQVMAPEEAWALSHAAPFGGHLVFPYAEGKIIKFIDTVPVEGRICHQIQVFSNPDFLVEYFIDIRDWVEVKVTSTNLRTGHSKTKIYRAYSNEFGFPIATHVDRYENGTKLSSTKIDAIEVNRGVMPWMFQMPR